MAMIKDAFKKSLQNSVSLDISKGILKKEVCIPLSVCGCKFYTSVSLFC